MSRKFDEVIEYFSRDNTIYPCEVLTSGTPSGTNIKKKDGSWYLKPGNTLAMRVENKGTLKNKIVSK